MKLRTRCLFKITLLAALASPVFAQNYYVNSASGDDSNVGTARNRPWKSLAPVHARNFLPGDTVNFECGSVWATGLEINDSGSPQRPVVFRAIGSGDKPVFSKGGKGAKAIDVTGAWVVLDGFLAKDANLAGVYLAKGADHNVVRNCELLNCGGGVMIHGRYNLITQNYAHDLVMVKNTVGGDDDYGAVAYWVFNANNEIAYNRAERCRAPSYDYGSDGGFFEIYTNGDSTYVHHNYAEDCNGFLEVGGGLARNVVVSHNISLDNGEFCFHLGKNFRADIQNFRLEHNMIVAKKGTKWNALLDWAGGTPQPGTLLMRNNLVVLGGEAVETVSRHGSFTHENNTYFLLDGARTGYPLTATETVQQPN
ncbi:MAG: hemolysin-type calcium-binding region [Sphingobacteriaceae bacterium]|nr:hemolysin-type calcium-binding region [Cytophagaceae bacterium]